MVLVRVLVLALLVGLAAPLTLAAATVPTGVTVISTSTYPMWAVSGFGSIWVADHHSDDLYRISPKTNRVVKIVSTRHSQCGEPALGAGVIFVGECDIEGSKTFEVSAKTNHVVRIFSGFTPVVADGSLWLLDPSGGFVERFDPRSGVRLTKIPTGLSDGAGAPGVHLGTSGAGSVWVGDQLAKTVLRIDTATNKVTAVIPLPSAATEQSPDQGNAAGGPMAFAGGKVWYANPAGIYEIDPATNTATLLHVQIGTLDGWGDIIFATGAGSVWVRTSSTTVTRIDPDTGNVVGSYPATGGGGGMCVAYGSLWVANSLTGTTWREPIQ